MTPAAEPQQDSVSKLFKDSQAAFAAALEQTVQREAFGELLARATENVMAVTKIAFDVADLIVLGTRGRTGLGKLLLGSQAEEIFRPAKCPVLTVGPHSQPISGGENELKEVLFATDFTPESQAAAPYAVSVALALQAHLNLLHVVEEPKTEELVYPTEVIPSSERLLRSLVPEDAHFWREPRYFVERGAVSEKILETAERIPASLIVLGVRGPMGIPGAAGHLSAGLAHKVVVNASCPVLTVRR